MKLLTLMNLGQVAIGLYTGNSQMVLRGAVGTFANSPLAEPLKNAIGNIYADVNWAEIAENYPF